MGPETAIEEEVVGGGGGERLGGGGVRSEGPEFKVRFNRRRAHEGEGVAGGGRGVDVVFVVHGGVGCDEEIRVYICVRRKREGMMVIVEDWFVGFRCGTCGVKIREVAS